MAAALTYLQSLREALHTQMEEDPRTLVLGEDILDPYGGAFKVTQGLSSRFPDRVFTTPISEAAIAGLSVGLALRGWRPIAEIMFGDFVALAADQLINHAAKYGAMYNGAVSAPLVVRTPMGGGRGYGPTHSQSLERIFLGIPHLTVLAPSHVHDAGALLRLAAAAEGPVLFVENKLLYPLPLLLAQTTPLAPGIALHRAETPDCWGCPVVTLRNYGESEAPDVTVITYGGMSRLLVEVMGRLAGEEVRVLACLPSSISPLDPAPLVAAAGESGRLLIVEESQAAFGWGAEVAALVQAAAGSRAALAVRRLGAQPTVIPAAKALEEQVLVAVAGIEAAILALLRDG
jgi:pyruvate/2-oxoglutarate/acetoin dehydrogenase E1 component